LQNAPVPSSLLHRQGRFSGRDPDEQHRSATPLELFYDLTIVVAFGTAADELAHFIAHAHAGAGIAGFAFATFMVVWAWLNYTWFASAYDTDDWLFRIATMVQMVGLIVLTLGLPKMFASIDHGVTLDNGVMVTGYLVMRAPLLFLWWQASRHDPRSAPAARIYIATIATAQVGWVALIFLKLPIVKTFLVFVALIAVEVVGPVVAERKGRTPWHAHHIAERFGLLTIITLGEVIIGTVAALNALVNGEAGWTTEATLLALAGVGLAFGCWWMYFAVPWAEPLVRYRERGFIFGYGHALIFGPLAAMGAGLHVGAYRLEGEATIGDTATVLSVALPVALFALTHFALYSLLFREFDPFRFGLLVGTGAVLGGSVLLAAAGVSMGICLLVLVLAPAVTVVGYETLRHRQMADALQQF
jgi:low temperature requirement protein LtrA